MTTPPTATDASSVFGASFLSANVGSAFAPEDFAADEQLMIQTAEQFSRKEVLPLVERLDAQEEGLMPGLIRKAGELGFCGPDTSDRYGGLGLGKNVAARMLEFLSLNASFSVTIGITSGISQVGLSLFGSEAQRAKYLPPLTSGEQIGAYCLSEPNSGTDALSLSTRADQSGDKWILNGTKMWISNAKWADQFVVMAKVGGEKITAFLVERGHPGVSVSREEHKLGLKGSSTARVILENAEIPLDNMLYVEGRGHILAFNALNLGRFKLASMSIGPARDAMMHSTAYSQDRKQFGAPIGSFGMIQRKQALMAARFFAAESMIYRTGALIDSAFARYHADSSLSEIEANLKSAEEFSIECSLCKVAATEAEAYIVDESLQIFGGYGFTEEFPLARIYRDCRVSRIYEGTNEINRFFIADRILRKVQDGRVGLPDASGGFIAELLGKALTSLHGHQPDQFQMSAIADLAILYYAEQSARLRVSRAPAMYGPVADLFANYAHSEAARAYQEMMGEAVTVPKPAPVDWDAIAASVVHCGGPVEAVLN